MTISKKRAILIFSLTAAIGLFCSAYTASAQTSYTTLAPLPGVGESLSIQGEGAFVGYLDAAFKLGIGLCTGLAVLMIVLGGVQYASTDAWGRKSEGKERITSAVLGLVIALGSWALLNTLSDRLVNPRLEIKPVTPGTLSSIGVRYPEDTQYLESTPGSIPARDPNYTVQYNEDGSIRVRSTYYYPEEPGGDKWTKNLQSSTGVTLRYADANTVGVAAVDPSLIPYGSRITVQTSEGPRYFIAADRGGAVVNRTASGGKEPVIDFFSNKQVGNDYSNVTIDYYRGGNFTNLSASQKESFFVYPTN
jgi:3D (Asp-Asp-Asp) domain-containing protein